MKIALAQCNSIPGDVVSNTSTHLRVIEYAANRGADAVFFSELSLTAYEPALAASLAFAADDSRLRSFEEVSMSQKMWVGVGMPCREEEGVSIGMRIFQPTGPGLINAKAFLHADEVPFFCGGQNLSNFSIYGLKIALAICYEISVEEHLHQAMTPDTGLYIASVAKHQKGMEDAAQRLSSIARKYKVPTMLVNAIGEADGMLCAGQSSVWDANGDLLSQLPPDEEGVLIYDTKDGRVAIN